MPTVFESISPEPMRQRLTELCAADAAARVLTYLLGSQEKLLQWAHTIGVVAQPALRDVVAPVPPLEMRRLSGSPDEPVFLWTGLQDVSNFLGIHARLASAPDGRKPRVLDFGCGAGRLTRFLDMHEGIEAFGVDANPAAVEWCQLNLTHVLTLLQAGRQKLPFGDALFDLVYSMTLFAETPPSRMRQCLDEITRVMAPGGLLLAVTYGPTAVETIRNSPAHQEQMRIDAARAAELAELLTQEGRVHVPFKEGEGPPDEQEGRTFVHPAYPAMHWNTEAFEVVEHIPAGLRHWQDIVVLRRK
jgi:SAM-dependent methyltransferase